MPQYRIVFDIEAPDDKTAKDLNDSLRGYVQENIQDFCMVRNSTVRVVSNHVQPRMDHNRFGLPL